MSFLFLSFSSLSLSSSIHNIVGECWNKIFCTITLRYYLIETLITMQKRKQNGQQTEGLTGNLVYNPDFKVNLRVLDITNFSIKALRELKTPFDATLLVHWCNPQTHIKCPIDIL